ncbi:MAG TPA: hypothetical protein VGI72_14410 [Gaiellales bacterium]|jgi:hypothetical protein
MTGRLTAAFAAALAVAAALPAAGLGPTPAFADGDPASDVLVYQPVFFPYRPAPHALQSHLAGLVRSANQQGYRIRIAIIQSRRDLGSVPALFGTPTVYARFLSSELSSIWRDRVLVVMPDGYGLAQDAHLVRSASGVERIKASTNGPDDVVVRHLARPAGGSPAALVTAAERALRALAARHDVALVAAPAHKPASGGGSSGQNLTLAAAVSAAVGLTAGLLWYLWRTRPTG